MKTAPFNLELAKQGHPLVTRGGIKVTQFVHFEAPYKQKGSSILSAVLEDGRLISTTISGCYWLDENTSNDDLLLDLETPWTPKYKMGDTILVTNNKGLPYSKRVFIKYGTGDTVICVRTDKEDLFNSGESFNTYRWKRHKPAPKGELKLVLTVNGKEIDPSTLSEESWAALRGR